MAKWEHNVRIELDIEDLDGFRDALAQFNIPESATVDTMLGLVYMEEQDDLYIFQSPDGSDPEDGYVDAPEFYLGKWEDGDKEHEVAGPFTWTGKYYQI